MGLVGTTTLIKHKSTEILIMTTSTQPVFVRNGNSVVNAATGTTLTNNGEFTLLLDSQCKKVVFDNGEGANVLFERLKKALKPNAKYGIKLEDGGFIDARIISTVFISPKTNNLIVMGLGEHAIYKFEEKDYADLEGLTEVILEALIDVEKNNKMLTIDWAAYKKL